MSNRGQLYEDAGLIAVVGLLLFILSSGKLYLAAPLALFGLAGFYLVVFGVPALLLCRQPLALKILAASFCCVSTAHLGLVIYHP